MRKRVALTLVLVSTLACGGGELPEEPGSVMPVAPTPPVRYFPEGAVWTSEISQGDLDPRSGEIIAWLDRRGWGIGRFQIDFRIEVLRADATTPRREFQPTDDFFSPDCDLEPVPLTLDCVRAAI
jgi:hypothetical protein